MRSQHIPPPRHRELAERFWAKVDRNGPIPERRPELGPCWIWLGGYTRAYGTFGPALDEHYIAHRFSYELAVGEIPSGYEIDHLCVTPACCNPAHLEPVTHAENCRRGNGFGGRNYRKTHCDAGHELAGDNLYVDPRGRRQCKACRAEAAARLRARRLRAVEDDAG